MSESKCEARVEFFCVSSLSQNKCEYFADYGGTLCTYYLPIDGSLYTGECCCKEARAEALNKLKETV